MVNKAVYIQWKIIFVAFFYPSQCCRVLPVSVIVHNDQNLREDHVRSLSLLPAARYMELVRILHSVWNRTTNVRKIRCILYNPLFQQMGVNSSNLENMQRLFNNFAVELWTADHVTLPSRGHQPPDLSSRQPRWLALHSALVTGLPNIIHSNQNLQLLWRIMLFVSNQQESFPAFLDYVNHLTEENMAGLAVQPCCRHQLARRLQKQSLITDHKTLNRRTESENNSLSGPADCDYQSKLQTTE